jgi:PAS domain S-box-containing protein
LHSIIDDLITISSSKSQSNSCENCAMDQIKQELCFFQGEGEIRSLLRTNDWSASPLGHPQTWPQELLTVVQLMLDSNFPMVVAWGPELGFLYNDAYVPIMGDKHPSSLGLRFEDVWSEVWLDISPIVDKALAGTSSYFEDLPLTLLRKGYPEQAWFTFSYSPVRDSTGAVAGMYCTVIETTSRVLSEKRQAFQLELADRIRSLAAPDDITAAASELLGRHLGVSGVFYAEVDEANGTFFIRRDWVQHGVKSVAGEVRRLDDFGPEIIATFRSGKVVVINNVASDPRTAKYAHAYIKEGVHSNLAIPLIKSGRLIATLGLHKAEPYDWTQRDIELAQDVAERTWSAVENARAQAELRAERDRSQRLLEGMDEGFKFLDSDFRVRQINAGVLRMEKRPASEIIGKTLWEAWPGTEDLPMTRAYRRAMKEQVPVNLEQFYDFPDGRRLWLDIHAYPANEGLAVFYRDITEKKNAEQALRAAEENIRNHHSYLRLLLDCTNEGFYSVDRNGLTTLCNAPFLRMLGFEREEDALGKKLHDVIHHSYPDGSHYDRKDCPIYRAAQTGEPAYIEDELFFRLDGSSFPVEYKVQPVWRDGRLEGAVCTFVDITQRKHAEEKLRETASRLEFTLEAAQVGDWDLDLVNDTAYRSLRHDQCFGYSEPIADWGFEKFIQHVHPEDREFVEQQFRTSVSELKDWHFECRVVWPDQSIHWIGAHGSIYHVNNKPTRMAGIVFDITERKQAEEALRESERRALEAARQAESERRRLNALLEAAPVGIIVADHKGNLQQVNRANKLLWGEHPFSKNVDEYIEWKGRWADGSEKHGRRLAPHEWAMARALHGEEAPRDIVEIEPFDEPGVRRTILNCGSSIKDGEGKIVGAVVAQMDITDRIKAEEALRQADRRKDEFLAMLAHELRNPLAPLSAAADLLSFAALDPQRVKQTSEVIARQVRHMAGLVDDLLDVSRVTRGLVELNKMDVDVKHIITDAVEQVSPLIEAKHHHLGIDLAPEPAHVLGDQKRLVQILTNVLNNAAKYTPEGGNIHLKMEVQDEQVILRVRDNGIGIEPELQPHLFGLFAQAKRSSARSQGGLGLGLALVKSLVELHGGKVTCFSEGVGKGSQFTVTLPRLVQKATVKEELHTNRNSQTAEKKLRILVVDDNVDAAQMLAMFLEASGHEVLVEHASKQALDRARIEVPDVCILDIGLPEMDGYALARCLRSQPETATSVLIAATGYGQEQDKKNALTAGFDHHLVKPVDATKLAFLIDGSNKI